MNIFIYLLTKVYYVWRNASRDRKWNAMSKDEKINYLATTKDEGNKRLDFRFAHYIYISPYAILRYVMMTASLAYVSRVEAVYRGS